jgi:hypothetical protein
VHQHVHQDDREILLRKKSEGLLTARSLDEGMAQVLEDHLQGDEIGGGVVHEQDVRPRRVRERLRLLA